MDSTAGVLLIKVNEINLYNDDSIYDTQQKESANSNNTGFIIINVPNKSIYWSTFFLKTLGINPNESASTFESLEELLHPSDKFLVDSILKKENPNEELFFKLRFRTKNQTYILLNSYLKSIN